MPLFKGHGSDPTIQHPPSGEVKAIRRGYLNFEGRSSLSPLCSPGAKGSGTLPCSVHARLSVSLLSSNAVLSASWKAIGEAIRMTNGPFSYSPQLEGTVRRTRAACTHSVFPQLPVRPFAWKLGGSPSTPARGMPRRATALILLYELTYCCLESSLGVSTPATYVAIHNLDCRGAEDWRKE